MHTLDSAVQAHEPAVDFLVQLHPDGPWHLIAFSANGGGPRKCFYSACPDPEGAARWIATHDGYDNCYVSINPEDSEPLSGKSAKANVELVRYLHVDLDPRVGESLEEEQTRLYQLLTEKRPADIREPTIITSSGGGLWGFWKLREPIAVNGDPGRIERYNRYLAEMFGADATCFNIDRITRLAGTTNLPDARKLAKGRAATQAEVRWYRPENVYSLDQFTPAAPLRSNGQASVDVSRLGNVDELDQWGVDARTKKIILNGSTPDGPQKPSRSEWLFGVVCQLLRANVPVDVVRSVITDSRLKISESVLEKGASAGRYAERQIERATVEVSSTFQANDKGVLFATQHNILLAIRKLGYALAHDVFADRLLVNDAHLDDAAMTGLYLEVERRFGFRAKKDYFWMVVEDAARANSFHPVRDYLDGLRWNGTPRCDRWLIDYAGAEDTPYVRAVSAIVLIAAVRRVRQPGCKFDEMLVLESPQGQAKSTALAMLAVRDAWFTEDLPLNAADTKRHMEALAGKWIVEAGELKGMRKGEVEHLKSFLSRRIDRARPAYGRLVTETPRQCIVVGTTNSALYLRDSTGNRRFWPVRIGEFDLDAVRTDRDQLWAEAAERETRGESIRLTRELWASAGIEQEARHVEDPFTLQLADVLGERNGKLRAIDAFRIVGVPPGQQTQDQNARVGEAMRALGWRRTKRRFGSGAEWCYVRGTDAEQQEVISPGGFTVHAAGEGGF